MIASKLFINAPIGHFYLECSICKCILILYTLSVPVRGRKPISPNLIQHAIDVKLVGGETQFRLTQPVFELELVGEGETRFA